MAGVAHEVLADLVGVLEAIENVVNNGELGALLSQLNTLLLTRRVNLLDPAVVVRSRGARDMLLELDDVSVWNGLSVGGGQDRSGTIVDGVDTEGRCSCSAGCERESDEASHCEVGNGAKERKRQRREEAMSD